MSEPPIRVLIADDHAVVREGLRHVLSAAGPSGRCEIVGEASNGREAVELARALRPDVVVLDLAMPVLSGLEAASQIRETLPDVSVLVLSIHNDEEYVRQSVRAGAQGYLRKDAPTADLRRAVRTIHRGGSVFESDRSPTQAPIPSARWAPAHRERLHTLTSRERSVLVEIARGRTNREIATDFDISIRTVESHREALMRKLGIRGAAGLTRFAVDCGIA